MPMFFSYFTKQMKNEVRGTGVDRERIDPMDGIIGYRDVARDVALRAGPSTCPLHYAYKLKRVVLL
jgi:hypothetical protein